jgi:hypothetical protein
MGVFRDDSVFRGDAYQTAFFCIVRVECALCCTRLPNLLYDRLFAISWSDEDLKRGGSVLFLFAERANCDVRRLLKRSGFDAPLGGGSSEGRSFVDATFAPISFEEDAFSPSGMPCISLACIRFALRSGTERCFLNDSLAPSSSAGTPCLNLASICFALRFGTERCFLNLLACTRSIAGLAGKDFPPLSSFPVISSPVYRAIRLLANESPFKWTLSADSWFSKLAARSFDVMSVFVG